MRKIDFISASPHLSIFNTESNKTNLGGVLFLIYILILFLLAIIYIYDYSTQKNYSFEYSFYKNDTNISIDPEVVKMRKMNYDSIFKLSKDHINDTYEEDLNQNDNFLIINYNKLEMKKNNREDYDTTDGFTIINPDDECIIEKDIKTEMPLSTLMVLYRCNGTICSIREEDKIKVDSYKLTFAYRGFSLDHQNPGKPLQLKPENHYFAKKIEFLESTNIVYLNWEVIKYIENKGVFSRVYDDIVGNNNTFYGMDIGSIQVYADDGHIRKFPSNFLKIKDENGNHFIVLLFLMNYINDNSQIYTRKAKSFLDVLTNVCALGSTILNLMALALSFLFSKNYDNYKIIENILTKKLRVNIKKDIEEKDISPNIELKSDLIGNLNDSNESQKMNINDDFNIEEGNKESNKIQDIDLPSIKFFDFLFHKLYFKWFGTSRKHSLINTCNDIISKYITIEKIVYNQMKLDYLWKDYKWNNPQYEIKERDDLIKDLKEK